MIDPLKPTIYHEDWWLSAATNNNWEEVLVHAGGQVVGRLPFIVSRIRGRRTMCQMPNLTHFLGPGVVEGNGSECNKTLRRDLIIRELVEKLPRTSGFYQKMHHGINDVVAFQQLGFQSSVEFTYEIHPRPLEELWRGMRDKTRNVIRRASEQVAIVHDLDPEEFIAVYNRNLASRNAISTYDTSCAINVCEAARIRGRGKILAIRDKSGMIEAAIFYVWDKRTVYYFMSTRSDGAHNGAIAYLVWKAILDAASKKLIFDFDGLGTNGSNLFYLGFGGGVAPRYTVHKANLPHSAVELLGRLAKSICLRR